MKQDLKPKIGFSQLGGIYIANNIKSDFHQHHLIAIILSFDNSFEIRLQNSQTTTHKAVLIQKDLNYSLKTDEISLTVFIHIDPYTEIGINLSQQNELIQNLDITNFSDVLLDLKNWFIETENKTENKTERTEILLKKITDIIINEYPSSKKIDDRILKCIQIIKDSDADNINLHRLSKEIHLSASRLRHLFKQETGTTIKKFLRHRKLVKSLQAMFENKNLTESSFIGGFSDQPHFTKTFKHSFGIKPSKSKNSL